MQYSLNPRGWKARFDLRKWQENNGRRFQELFGYTKETMHEAFYFPRQDKAYFEEKINETIRQINEKYLKEEKLNAEQFRHIGAKYNYSRAFFINMSKLKSRFQRGDYPLNPAFFVARGRDIRPDEFVGLNKREGKGAWQEKRLHRHLAVSSSNIRFRELLSAFKQYRPFDYVRDPMLFEGEIRRKRSFWKGEGKEQERED